MSTQSTEYISCSRVCCGELPADVILCVPSELVESDNPFINATIASEAIIKTPCNGNSWRYIFTYDNSQLVEGAILTGDVITGVLCKDCLYTWVNALTEGNTIPSQEGHAGEFLSTDGTDLSWEPEGAGGDMTKAVYDPANIGEQLLGITAAQVITNKTIDADLNTITNIQNADIKAAAAIALNKLAATTVFRALVSDGSGFVSPSVTTLTELSYVSGATSSLQDQIDLKQPLDATLTALASYNTNGLLTQTAADTFVGRTLTGTAGEITITNGTGVAGNPTVSIVSNLKKDLIEINITNGGSAIGTGIIQDVSIPFSCTINSVTLLADQAGSIVVDIWKDTYANYPPTNADSITAAAKPTISAATKSTDSTLTGWTTSVAAGDILRFNVDSAATVTRVKLTLGVTK